MVGVILFHNRISKCWSLGKPLLLLNLFILRVSSCDGIFIYISAISIPHILGFFGCKDDILGYEFYGRK
jgi:hypothetical protein